MTAVNTQSGYSNAGDISAAPHPRYTITILGSRSQVHNFSVDIKNHRAFLSEGEGDKTCWLADRELKTTPLSVELREAIRRLRDSVEQELGNTIVNTDQIHNIKLH